MDKQPKSSSSSQEDDDSECWDDAKALLNDDINPVQQQQQQNDLGADQLDSPMAAAVTTTTTTTDFRSQASSSSAHSSIQSNNNNNTSSLASHKQALKQQQHSDELVLHEAIFKNDTKEILRILDDVDLIKKRDLVDKKDKHGNTALHLACILGRSAEIISALLRPQAKWSIDAKNLNRWTPFHEACAYGDREVIKLMAKQLKDDVDDVLHNHKLSKYLEKTKNFRLVLKWEFQSWVPFVSRVLPSDVCVIVKHGNCMRISTRLLDFDNLFRKKGGTCLVYSKEKWIVINNRLKKYQYLETPNVGKDIEERVDGIMSSDIIDMELKSSEMQLTRSTSGWIWKADKVGKVGRYNAALYEVSNVFLLMRKRREHLSDDDLKRNKTAYKSFVQYFEFGQETNNNNNNKSGGRTNKDLDTTNIGGSSKGRVNKNSSDNSNNDDADNNNDNDTGDDTGELAAKHRQNKTKTNHDNSSCEDNTNHPSDREADDEDEDEVQHRESVPPPPETQVTWEEYLSSEPPGEYPTIGREQKCKIVKKPFKASIAMSEEFPMTKEEFLDLLSVVPLKLFKKLKEFVEMKLPDGFPVRLDIPIFPFLTARITLEDFNFIDSPTMDESLFTVPADYELDTKLLPLNDPDDD